MGYGTDGLTFNALRGANKARLPQFRNSRGELAHSKPDGSDWSPAQWFQALIGELGEYARCRTDYEQGLITFTQYGEQASKELADVQIYLDLLAQRALDQVQDLVPNDAAQCLQHVVMHLGEYANKRKKFDRGDMATVAFDVASYAHIEQLFYACNALGLARLLVIKNAVTEEREGVDLGRATIDKFNEVSERVGSNVRLAANDWHYDHSV